MLRIVRWLACFLIAPMWAGIACAQAFQPDVFDHSKVVGYEQCVKCHTQQIEVLKQHPHFAAQMPLHRRPEAIAMAKKLGYRSVKRAESCVKCHYTPQQNGDRVKAISGISCESCHGPAADWITMHNDYGGPNVTKDTETPAHKQQRIVASIDRGLRHPSHLYLLARSCYRCHIISDEKLVNVGGHPWRSEGFDGQSFNMVAWSQGNMRHNFLRSNGEVNEPSGPERLRVMHLVSLLTDMEYTLRATANATQRDSFAFKQAGSAFALRNQIAQLDERFRAANVVVPGFHNASETAMSAKLSLENGAGLIQAADRLSQFAWQLSSEADGKRLVLVDEWLPRTDSHIGTPILRASQFGN